MLQYLTRSFIATTEINEDNSRFFFWEIYKHRMTNSLNPTVVFNTVAVWAVLPCVLKINAGPNF